MKARWQVTRSIGDVAAELGIQTHVLRRWEHVGALTVSRDRAGYRAYEDGAIEQARTVLKLRRVGLSLPEVIAAMAPRKSAAQAIVLAKIAVLEEEIVRKKQAITFLQHIVECRHRYLDECADCSAFIGDP